MDGELKPILVLVDQAFDFEEIILLEGLENVVNVIPHLSFQLAGAVSHGEGQIRFAGLFRLDLLSDDNKGRSDDLVLVADAVANVEVLHERYAMSISEARTKKSTY